MNIREPGRRRPAMMLNHHEIYELFARLDSTPAVWDVRIGNWRAWPMVKMQLLWGMMAASPAGLKLGGERRAAARVIGRFANLQPILRSARRNRGANRRAPVALMISPYGTVGPDGVLADRFFGSLKAEAFPFPFTVLRYPVDGRDATVLADASVRNLAPTVFLAEQLAALLMWSPRVCRPAEVLTRTLVAAGLPLPTAAVGFQARLALAMFEARRRLFGRLFDAIAPRLAVLTYAPGRMGDIAAARERGIHVVELQHGMFGAACPDYRWPAEAGRWRGEIPLPETFAVFGPFFRESLLAGGFWRGDEVSVIGAAHLDGRAVAGARDRAPDAPFHLLFLTQPVTAWAGTRFLGETLERLAAAGRRDIHVTLKLHQRDTEDLPDYQALAQAHPDLMSFLPADADSVATMAGADAVAGFNSLGLAEAAALGTTPISICGGATPGGFAGSFGDEQVRAAMPHVGTPEELIATLETMGDRREDQDALAELGRRFFAPGFADNLSALVTARLERSD